MISIKNKLKNGKIETDILIEDFINKKEITKFLEMYKNFDKVDYYISLENGFINDIELIIHTEQCPNFLELDGFKKKYNGFVCNVDNTGEYFNFGYIVNYKPQIDNKVLYISPF